MLSLRLNLIAVVFLAALIFLQYRLWFQPGGMHDISTIKAVLAVQTKENQTLKKRNDELVLQIERLQRSQDTVESRARNELGMVKKDEVFYQVVRKENENTD